MKQAIEKKEQQKNIAGTLFVFLGFVVFVIVFASLGDSESFRETKSQSSLWGVSEENQKFIQTHMPYFPMFALDYTKH